MTRSSLFLIGPSRDYLYFSHGLVHHHNSRQFPAITIRALGPPFFFAIFFIRFDERYSASTKHVRDVDLFYPVFLPFGFGVTRVKDGRAPGDAP
jgi:hypothetical protein